MLPDVLGGTQTNQPDVDAMMNEIAPRPVAPVPTPAPAAPQGPAPLPVIEKDPAFQSLSPKEKRQFAGSWAQSLPEFSQLDSHSQQKFINDVQGRYPDPAPAVASAVRQYKDTPYVWGGNEGTKGTDCSGMVCSVMKQFGIMDLPRTAMEQFNNPKAQQVDPSDPNNLRPGDAIYFHDTGGRRGITHVAVYLGDGRYGQMSGKNTGYREGQVGDSMWQNKLAGVRRFLPDAPAAPASTPVASTFDFAGQLMRSQPTQTPGPLDGIPQKQVDDFRLKFFNTDNPKANIPMATAVALAANPKDTANLARLSKMSPIAQKAIMQKADELAQQADLNRNTALSPGSYSPEIGYQPGFAYDKRTNTPVIEHPSEAIAKAIRGPEGARILQQSPGFFPAAEKFLYSLADPEQYGLVLGAGGIGAAIPKLLPFISAGFAGAQGKAAYDKWQAGDRGGALFEALLAGMAGAHAGKGGGKLATDAASAIGDRVLGKDFATGDLSEGLTGNRGFPDKFTYKGNDFAVRLDERGNPVMGANGKPVYDLATKAAEPTNPGASTAVPDQTQTTVQPTPPLDAAAEPKHKFSSTQVNLPPDVGAKLRALGETIPAKELAEDGVETQPHITVKYGLHTNDVEAVRRVLADEPPIKATLGKTSIFDSAETGSDYDVVKADIDSPDLHRLNAKIADALPHTDTHPEYKPHATVAYVKAGEGAKYVGSDAVAGTEVPIDRIVFSDRNGKQFEIRLKGRGAPLENPQRNLGVDEPRPNGANVSSGPNVLAETETTAVTPEPVHPYEQTSARMDSMARDRAELDLPELPSSERKGWQTSLDNAQKAGIPVRAAAIAEEVRRKPRALNDEETAGLALRAQQIKDAHTALMKQAEGTTDADTLQQIRSQQTGLQEEFDTLSDALKKSGTEKGRALASQKLTLNSDYDLVTVRNRMKVANPEKPVTPQEDARVTDLATRLKEAETQLAAHQDRIKELEAQRQVRREAMKDAQERKRTGRTQKRQDLREEFTSLLDQFRKVGEADESGNVKMHSVLSDEHAKIIGKMAVNLVKQGVNEAGALVDAIHAVVAEHMPDVTREEIRDAISGYGKTAEPTRDEAVKTLGELRRQMRLVAAIEAAEKGQRPASSGFQPEQMSEKVKALRKQLNDAMLRQGLKEPAAARDPLPAIKTRLTNQITELQGKIARGEYEPEPKRPATPLDPEGQRLKLERDRLKHEIDQVIASRQKPHWTDYVTRWQRMSLLSGVTTLGKLAAAASGRIAETPLEEMVGGVFSRSKLAQKAPREGTFNPKAEAKALTEAFSKATLTDMWQKLRTGANSLDVQFGKAEAHHPILDFFGSLHGALKTPAQRGEFFRAYEKRAEFAARQGADLKDPTVQLEIGGQAYADSKRAILMGENGAVTAYRQVLYAIRRQGEGGKVAAAVMKSVTPIVSVPTNYITEGANYVAGGPIGVARILINGGVDKLTPAQADMVMRSFKKQGIGMALLAIGYLQPDGMKAGGYYAKDDKTRPGEPESGTIQFFGHTLPRWASHTPALEAVQVGATLRRAIDHTRGTFTERVMTGLHHAAAGMIEEVPFADQAIRAGRALESPDQAGKYLGEYSRTMAIPVGVQQAAAYTDKDKQGQPVRRKPKGFTDTLKMGVPGLREQVPEKTDAGSGLPHLPRLPSLRRR